MAKSAHHKVPSLEREVIMSVTILYLLICAGMLAIHYVQPKSQETKTSSTSPSHGELRGDNLGGAEKTFLTQVEANILLIRQGYEEIRGLRVDGDRYVAQAIKGGKTVGVTIDAKTGAVADTH